MTCIEDGAEHDSAHCLAYGHAFDGLSCGCCGAVEYA